MASNRGHQLLVPAKGAGAGAAPPPAFDPLTDVTWFAYYDAVTTFGGTADGTAVSSWTDLSGNARHATQATGTKQPAVQTTGGLKEVRFGGDDGLQLPSIAWGTDKLNLFFVGNVTADGTDQAIAELTDNFNGTENSFIVYRASTNQLKVSFNVTAGYNEFTTEDGADPLKKYDSTRRVTCATLDLDIGCLVYRGGTIFGTESPTNTDTGNFVAGVVNVGARNAASLFLTGNLNFFAIAGDLTAAQRWNMLAYLGDRFALEPQNGILVFDGDSLTYGQIVAARTPTPYPNQVISALTGKYAWDNYGVSGQTLVQMDADKATQITPNYNATAPKNVLVLWGGTNDMAAGVGNVDGATAIARLYALADYHRGIGWKVVVVDCPPRSDAAAGGTFNARRAAFNTDFASNAASHADAVVRVSTDTRIGDNGDELDTTYYTADKVHLNATGYGVVAGLVRTALATLGVT